MPSLTYPTTYRSRSVEEALGALRQSFADLGAGLTSARKEPVVAKFYVLGEDERPVPCVDAERWRLWMMHSLEIPGRRVGLDQAGRAFVSTVFTGTEMGRDATGRPLLWETLVTTDEDAAVRTHYATALDAARGHEDAILRARSSRGIRLR